MSELEKKSEEVETPSSDEANAGPEMIRRDFFKRFGGYAAGTCVGLFVLLGPGTSKVHAS